MKLKDYLEGLTDPERRAFAKACGTTTNYLCQLKIKHRTPSPRLCLRLVRASGGVLTLEELRPDVWRGKPV